MRKENAVLIHNGIKYRDYQGWFKVKDFFIFYMSLSTTDFLEVYSRPKTRNKKAIDRIKLNLGENRFSITNIKDVGFFNYGRYKKCLCLQCTNGTRVSLPIDIGHEWELIFPKMFDWTGFPLERIPFLEPYPLLEAPEDMPIPTMSEDDIDG